MEHRQGVIVCALIVLFSASVYWPVAEFPFIDFDDYDYVVNNPIVADGLTAEALRRAFLEVHASNWHPLTWIAHMLDVSWFGLDAGGHHAVNAAIHTLNACLLFWVLLAMTAPRARLARTTSPGVAVPFGDCDDPACGASRRRIPAPTLWPCALVAGLFAVHPAHVESVAWVSERKDTLCGLFWILTMAAYLRHARRPSLGRYALVFLCALLALLAKPMAVTLPFALLLLDVWPLGRIRSPGPPWRRVLWEKVPIVILAVGVAWIALAGQSASGALKSADWVPIGERLASAPVAYLHYLGMAFWPVDLAVFYPRFEWRFGWPFESSGLGSPVLGLGALLAAVAILAGVSVLAWWQRKSRPFLLMGWLWFVGSLIPVIGLVPVGDQSFADRYSYIPSIGLSIAVIWGVESVWPRHRGRAAALAALAVAAFAACVPLAQRQVETWRSPMALWSHASEVTPHSAMAHYHLARLYAAGRDPARAHHHAARAAAQKPGAPVVQHMLGVALSLVERHGDARKRFELALALDPHFAAAKASLAEELRRSGDLSGAIALFDEAALEDRKLLRAPFVQSSFARALAQRFRKGDHFERGVAEYRRMLLRHPGLHFAAGDLAWILSSREGVTEEEAKEAVAWAEHALRVSGDPSPVHLDTLSLALSAAGLAEEARATSERASRLAVEMGHFDFADEVRARTRSQTAR